MNTYANKDFYLSSFLLSNGCRLIDTSVNEGMTTFIFEKSEELKTLLNKYYSLSSRVEPMAYSQAIRTLKSIIHASKSNSKSYSQNERYTICTAIE